MEKERSLEELDVRRQSVMLGELLDPLPGSHLEQQAVIPQGPLVPPLDVRGVNGGLRRRLVGALGRRLHTDNLAVALDKERVMPEPHAAEDIAQRPCKLRRGDPMLHLSIVYRDT